MVFSVFVELIDPRIRHVTPVRLKTPDQVVIHHAAAPTASPAMVSAA